MRDPTKIHILWHSWALPTWETTTLRRETVNLLDAYLRYKWPNVVVLCSFDNELLREVDAHIEFAYDDLSILEQEAMRIVCMKEVAPLVGDVMRYFVAKDSFDRMQYARNTRNRDHNAYGLGANRDTIPFPPRGDVHMPRFPLEFDKTYDGSKIYTGPIGPGTFD